MRQLLIFIVIFFSFASAYSKLTGSHNVDSLKIALISAPDTLKVMIFNELSDIYLETDITESLQYADQANILANQLNHPKLLAQCFIRFGIIYHRQAKYDLALASYEKALALGKQYKLQKIVANTYTNIGTLYQDKGINDKAVEYLLKALKMNEEQGEKENMATTYNNLGLVYFGQKNYQQALFYYNHSLDIQQELKNKNGLALEYNNIGIVYYYTGEMDKVLEYFNKALGIYEELGNLRGQSMPLFNIAEIYNERKQYDKALAYYYKSFQIDSMLNDAKGQCTELIAIGQVYANMKQFSKAIVYQNKGIVIAQKMNALPDLRDGYYYLSETYEKTGDYKNAYRYLQKSYTLQDSVYTDESAHHQAEMEVKYETEKKEKEIEILNKDKLLQELKVDRQKLIIRRQLSLWLITMAATIIICIFLVILLRQKKQKQKTMRLLEYQNAEINIQKEELQTALDKNYEQNQELEKAYLEIRDMAKTKEMFLANTSHEIRTPLNVIIGFTNLVLKTSLSPLQKNYLENVKHSSDNLLILINDLLTLSKIEAGKLIIEEIDFDLHENILHFVKGLEVKANEKNLKFNFLIHNDVPIFVKGDPLRVIQIIQNLVDNAFKFTPQGGFVKIEAVLESSEPEFSNICFSVQDSGIGIDAEKIDKIFQSFNQADNDTTRKYGGTGLGLAIVKNLVSLLNGRLWVESTPGMGSRFFFVVPFRFSDGKSVVHVDKEETLETGDLELHILLVEDNYLNTQLAIDTLLSTGRKLIIHHAENGRIAIEKLKTHNYDLVIMDIQMPEMDGYEATNIIRNRFPDPVNKIPILAMTAHALREEEERCRNLGMDGYVTKPFEPEKLFREINRILAHLVKHNPLEHQDSFKTGKHEPTGLINLDLLLKTYHNNQQKLNQLLKMCIDKVPGQITEMEDDYRKGDYKLASVQAHSLKTTLKYLGVNELSAIFLNLETLFKKDNPGAEPDALIQLCHQVWGKVDEELQKII